MDKRYSLRQHTRARLRTRPHQLQRQRGEMFMARLVTCSKSTHRPSVLATAAEESGVDRRSDRHAAAKAARPTRPPGAEPTWAPARAMATAGSPSAVRRSVCRLRLRSAVHRPRPPPSPLLSSPLLSSPLLSSPFPRRGLRLRDVHADQSPKGRHARHDAAASHGWRLYRRLCSRARGGGVAGLTVTAFGAAVARRSRPPARHRRHRPAVTWRAPRGR